MLPGREQFFIYKGDLSPTGNIIFHFDSHPDLLHPNKNNWILSEVCKGFFSTLVWIKPPWSDQIRDGSYTLLIGKDDSGKIGVNSNLPIFVSNCMYTSLEKLQNPKEVLLEVVTFGKSVIGSQEKDDFHNFLERIKSRFPENGYYFLNVDLDFFSTYNPYEEIYAGADLYDQLIELYWYGVNENMSARELESSVRTRRKQLSDLEKLWKQLAEKGMALSPPKTELWKELKPIASQLLAKYSEIDWELIHTAGCTWTDKGDPLVKHLTTRDIIKKLIRAVLNDFILLLPHKLAAITIPMLENNYCPVEEEDFIYKELMSMIESKFKIKTNELYIS